MSKHPRAIVVFVGLVLVFLALASAFMMTPRMAASGSDSIYPDAARDQQGIRRPQEFITSPAAYDVALFPDGSVIGVGGASNSIVDAPNNLFLAKFHSDGTFDTSFDGDGYLNANLGLGYASREGGQAVAVDSQNRIVVGGDYAISGNQTGIFFARYLVDGTLDSTFGDAGITTFTLNGIYVYDILIGAGDSVTAVVAPTDSLSRSSLVRLTAEGDPDPTFGVAGVVTVGSIQYRRLLAGPNNTVLVGGGVDFIYVSRYLSNGTLDPTYGVAGTTVLDDAVQLSDFDATPDGGVMIATRQFDTQSPFGRPAAIKLTADGALDASFDEDGIWSETLPAPVSQVSGFSTVSVAATGKATFWGAGGTHRAYVQLRSDGTFDPDFDGDGIRNVTIDGFDVYGEMERDPDSGVLYLPGRQGMWALQKINANGSAEGGFGNPGEIFVSARRTAIGRTLAVQTDGKILAVQDSWLARLNADGSPDMTFGDGGYRMIYEHPTIRPDITQGVAQMPNGTIATGGNSRPSNGNGVYGWRLNRYLPDGTPDGTFGVNGEVFTTSTVSTTLSMILPQPDGTLLASGRPAVNASLYRTSVRRYLADGTPDTGFGTNGELTFANCTINSVSPVSLRLTPDNKIMVIAVCASGGSVTRVGRFLPDGTPDVTYNGDGFADVPSFAPDRGGEAILQADGKLLLVSHSGSNVRLAQLLADGTLDPNFGTGGYSTIPIVVEGTDGSTLSSVSMAGAARDGAGRWLMVGSGGDGPFFATSFAVRVLANGTVDNSFGVGGFVNMRVARRDELNDMIMTADGTVWVTGGFAMSTNSQEHPKGQVVAYRVADQLPLTPTPSVTLTPSMTLTPSGTATPTITHTPVSPTLTPSPTCCTPVATVTHTPSITPAAPSSTPTPVTATPTLDPTEIAATGTATFTPVPTNSATPRPTETATRTVTPPGTNTVTPPATVTPVSTSTVTPGIPPATVTSVGTLTSTPSGTPTPGTTTPTGTIAVPSATPTTGTYGLYLPLVSVRAEQR